MRGCVHRSHFGRARSADGVGQDPARASARVRSRENRYGKLARFLV
jgi:hypothetical protein